MSVAVIRPSRPLPTSAWDAQAMRQYALLVQAAIAERTFHRGVGENDRPLAPYSRKPMTVSFNSETARRLAPKGGLPAYGRGHPRRLLGASGRAPRGSGLVITGRHYPEGYGQYKRLSRRGLTNKIGASGAAVDLVQSGQLERSFAITSVSKDRAVIAITGAAREYGPATDAARPWIGLSPNDRQDVDAALPNIILDAIDRSRK